MSNIFFISDTHFGHVNVIRFCHRPYTNVNDMDVDIIQKWNSVVSKNDIVYMVGDFSWREPTIYLKQLNGKIILIAGGHDYRWKRHFHLFHEVHDTMTIRIGIQPIILSHFCYRVWNKSHYGSWHLFGHSHGRLEPIGKSWDVGIDANSYGPPLSLDQITEIMKDRSDNINLVRKNG